MVRVDLNRALGARAVATTFSSATPASATSTSTAAAETTSDVAAADATVPAAATSYRYIGGGPDHLLMLEAGLMVAGRGQARFSAARVPLAQQSNQRRRKPFYPVVGPPRKFL